MARKGHAANKKVCNKKRMLQTKKIRCKQKTNATNKKGNRCKQERKPLQTKKTGELQTKKETIANKRERLPTKKQNPQRGEEELRNFGVRYNLKSTHIMPGMV